jgi:hypothetical protein
MPTQSKVVGQRAANALARGSCDCSGKIIGVFFRALVLADVFAPRAFACLLHRSHASSVLPNVFSPGHTQGHNTVLGIGKKKEEETKAFSPAVLPASILAAVGGHPIDPNRLQSVSSSFLPFSSGFVRKSGADCAPMIIFIGFGVPLSHLVRKITHVS